MQVKPCAKRMNRRAFLGASIATTSIVSLAPAFAKIRFDDVLAQHDATALGEMVKTKRVSPIELVEGAIARIENIDLDLHAISAEGFDLARERAASVDIMSGAFPGVPYLVKDLLEYPGLPFESGSRMFRGNISGWESNYISTTEKSGLVVLGKTSTPEFGLLPTTEPLIGKPTRNPWDLNYSPGGSSGGSAAAVAAGLVPFSHASDGGGSIRIPAAMCGLFGFKPSRGRQRISRRTKLPADIAVDHCVSWSVRDSAKLLSLTERPSGAGHYEPIGYVSAADSKRLKIGCIFTSPFGKGVSEETSIALRSFAELCEDLGHVVDDAKWPFSGEELEYNFMTVWGAGAAGVIRLYTQKTGLAPDASVLEPWTLGLASEFQRRGLPALESSLRYFDTLTKKANAWFDTFDVFFTPVVRQEKLPIGFLAPTRDFESLRSAVTDFAPYTACQNVIGAPAMSVPIGLSTEGFPIGGHFWAKAGNDAMLMRLAYELESAAPWAQRRPSVGA